jgi:hypothetical protein
MIYDMHLIRKPWVARFVFGIIAFMVTACGGGGGGKEDDGQTEEAADVPLDGDEEAAGDPAADEAVPEPVEDEASEAAADTVEDEAIEDADAADVAEEEEAPPEYVRGSLASCLLDRGCGRVGVTSHMGAWTAAIPGNSMAAFRRAWELGADAIESDIRVSADGVPFMIHDDEITLYESLLCAGKVVSESTADEIDNCLLLPSLTETIPTFEEFVTWARGKILIHLDVKETDALGVMVEQIIARGAQDFVFIAISSGEALDVVPSIPGSDGVYFLLRVGSVPEVDLALGDLRRPNIFMLEGDRTWDTVDETQMMVQVGRVHDGGLRIMASSDQYTPTIADHLHLYDMGFDYVLSYNCENGVEAAREENIARGYPP